MGNITGIDLGTTYSALAILNPIGKPQVVPNADGDRLTPSAIYFDEDNNQIVRVGIEAINSRHINPNRSIRWVKRHMGDPDFHKVVDGTSWSAVELSAFILKKLKQDATAEYGPIDDVVISVPAHFDEIRRKATMDAGKHAGLHVVGIVNEPVAAALYYATSQQVGGRVLIYDLGGGTFDVTLMQVNGHQIDILCSHGDHALGGVDFDQKILEILAQRYQAQYQQALIQSEEDQARYEDEAEDIKRTLSRRPVAKKMLYGSSGSLKVELTREDFETAVGALLGRTDMLVDIALKEANIEASEVDEVLLVGGSTRIPAVQRRLEKRFGFPPKAAVNVDECVALGAALHCGLTLLMQNPHKVPTGMASGLGDVQLTDVCNHSYGTLCAPIDRETGRRVVENRIILNKNTPLPCDAMQTFYTMRDGQDQIQVTITQGEDHDPRFVNTIATYTFELPPDRPAGRPVEVTYSYDRNQRMHCRFHDIESDRSLEVDLALDPSDPIQGNAVDANTLESVNIH